MPLAALRPCGSFSGSWHINQLGRLRDSGMVANPREMHVTDFAHIRHLQTRFNPLLDIS